MLLDWRRGKEKPKSFCMGFPNICTFDCKEQCEKCEASAVPCHGSFQEKLFPLNEQMVK